MKFLYVIDILPIDADLSNNSAGTYNSPGVRRVHLLTNFERQVPFSSISGFWSSFIAAPGASDIVSGSATAFVPVAGVSHSGVTLNSENTAGDITLTLPIDHAVSQLFVYEAPAAQLWLTIYAFDDESGSTIVQWTGRLNSCEWSPPVASFKCSHLSSVLKRAGLTRKHPRTCGHTLYGPAPGCAIDRNEIISGNYFSYREDGFISTVTDGGLTLVVPEATNRVDGFFTEGFIAVEPVYDGNTSAWPHKPRALYPTDPTSGTGGAPGTPLFGGFRRHIVSHVGNALHLSAPLLSPLTSPVRVSLFAGCNLLPATCQGKFNNFPRFGGYPYIPIKNVFESGLTG